MGFTVFDHLVVGRIYSPGPTALGAAAAPGSSKVTVAFFLENSARLGLYQKVFFLDQRVVYLITFNNDRNFYDTSPFLFT